MSLWCCAATSQMHFHHRRYQAISATQIVDTLGVVGGRSLPRRAKRWRPSCETRRSASTYDSKKKPEVGKPANLAASRNNSNSWPPTEVAPGMPVGVRLSGHTRFYNSDSLPKGLSWMPGYRIEPLRQRCSNDVADSSVTSVQGHCLRSRGLPHNAKRVSVRPKQPLCSCSGGVVYQLVCEQFRSRRRSRKNDDDGERKDVAYISMPVIQDEYTNSEKVSSEVDNKEGVVDDRGKTGYHKQDQKEDSPRDDADNNEASFVDSRNKENAMRGTYTIKATHATMSLTVQEVRTIAETKSEGHENASDGSSVNSDSSRSTDSPSTHGASQSPRRAESDDGSIEEDINNEDSDSDA